MAFEPQAASCSHVSTHRGHAFPARPWATALCAEELTEIHLTNLLCISFLLSSPLNKCSRDSMTEQLIKLHCYVQYAETLKQAHHRSELRRPCFPHGDDGWIILIYCIFREFRWTTKLRLIPVVYVWYLTLIHIMSAISSFQTSVLQQ
jgi:hypothetical protein